MIYLFLGGRDMQATHKGITLRSLIQEAFLRGRGLDRFGRNRRAWQKEADKLTQWFQNYYGGNQDDRMQGCEEVLDTTLDDIVKNKEEFSENILSGIKALAKDKYLYVLKVEHLLKYLNDEYDAGISMDFLDHLKWKEKDDRLLKILKYLHSGGKSREDIARVFGISKRVLDDDLATLKEGFEFMGTYMEIGTLKRGENTYTSPIHPIFLALNSAEIYALTLGLKLLSKDTVFEHALSRVADQVYQQLSDFAQGMVESHPESGEVYFGNQKRRFMSSLELARQYNLPFCQYLKEPTLCKLFYNSGDTIEQVVGVLHLCPKEGPDRFRKIIVRNEKEDIELHVNDVVRIERVNE